ATDSVGVVSGPDAAVLTLRPESRDLIAWPSGTSPAWRALAVSILHEGLLRPLLGIDDARLDAKTHVEYTADQAEAVRLARAGTYQAAFLIAPTTPAEPQAIVAANPYVAADARELIGVEWDVLPTFATLDAALAEKRILFERRHRHGDVDGAFARAAIVVAETFEHDRCAPSPLELRGMAADW